MSSISEHLALPARHAHVSRAAILRSQEPRAFLPVSDRSDANEREAERVASNVDRGRGATVANATRHRASTGNASRSTFGLDGGMPLAPSLRAKFEPKFGMDLSRVRVHTGANAAALARAYGADALTIGNQVVFGERRYRPESADGQRLISHELTHVAQGNTAVVHRQPGVNARETWDALVRVIPIRPASRRSVVEEAINRLLRLPSGARLVNRLWSVLRRGSSRSHVTLQFVDEIPEGIEGADGFFQPDSPNQPAYSVFVRYREPLSAERRRNTLGGMWPGGSSGIGFSYTHADSESSMASTLHHELLHIWFLHSGTDAIFPTGHRDVERGEIEPVFLDRLREFSAELDALEARARTQVPPVAPDVPAREPPEPRGTLPTEPSRPSLVGGQVSFHAGGSGGPGGERGAAIAGADLILGRIDSFRLGARGVYLTPNHLLAGGAIGARFMQGPGVGAFSERPQNPLFFDVEAGLLTELRPSDATRLTNNVAGLGSIGVGQEFGTSGGRFFWRVGAFVLISDRDPRNPTLGGTAGIGARF